MVEQTKAAEEQRKAATADRLPHSPSTATTATLA